MDRKRMMFFAYGGALLILAVFAVLLYSFSGDTVAVTLPTPVISSAPISTDPGGSNNGELKQLKVTPENVQAVIATMKRPESYLNSIKVKSMWSSGEAEYNIASFVRSGVARIIASGPRGATKNIIITDKSVFIWNEGSSAYYSGSLGGSTGPALLDEYEKVPTYEDVLALSKTDIQEAAFTVYGEEPCIYIRAQSGDFDYYYTYYVSVNTGILIASSVFDGDVLIYSMASNGVTLTVPSDEMFKLPDGKSAITS